MPEKTMRIVTQHEFGGPEVLQVESAPVPEPLPTEVLVRVLAAGINPVDLTTRQGSGMASVLGEPPFTIGWDVAGVVEAVGRGVTTLAPGDAVFGMPWFPRQAGAYADYVTAPSRQFTHQPGGIDHVEAGALPLASLTAWQALVDTAQISAGQRVLVHAGAGGVGHLAVQIAATFGARVITTASAERKDFLRELGAEQVIDYRNVRFEDEVQEVDVVLDLIGGEEYGPRSVSVIRQGGLYIGVPGGVSEPAAAAARDKGVHTTGILVEPDSFGLRQIAQLVSEGKVRAEVQKRYPLERVADAHTEAERGHTRGKLVLDLTA